MLSENISRVIGLLLDRGILDPKNMGRLNLELVTSSEHRPQFEQMIEQFDTLIGNLNETLHPDYEPESYLRNIRNWRKIAPSISLPTISELLAGCAVDDNNKYFNRFSRSVTTMAKRLQGELTFHHQDTDPQSILWGAIFHAYGEYIVRDKRISHKVTSDEVVDLVTEASLYAQTGSDAIFQALTEEKKLNWVRGWDGIDPRLRKLVLGSEPVPGYETGKVVRRTDHFIVIMADKQAEPKEGGRFFLVPLTGQGEGMLRRAAIKHFFWLNTESRNLDPADGQTSRLCIRMDLSQEVWDDLIAADTFTYPTAQAHSIPPIQHMEDLIANGETEYRFPTS